MLETGADILSETARHARRLENELESRRIDMNAAWPAAVQSQLQNGTKAIDTALDAVRRVLAAVQCEMKDGRHSSDLTDIQ